jgi:hypothetical protein
VLAHLISRPRPFASGHSLEEKHHSFVSNQKSLTEISNDISFFLLGENA